MKNPRQIIRKPLTSEKTTDMRISENKYVFRVDKNANKVEIKRAIEELFKVKVEDVTTMIRYGKPKRLGRYEGRRPDWKKAIVKLKKGETIGFFETV